jgi:superfamily II DNA or RNA helicase
MNAVKITQTLKQALVNYLTTTFDANKDGKEPELARKIRESFEEPRALFTGPYLELIYPYIKGACLNDLIDEGILTDQIKSLSCFNLLKPEPLPLGAPLYSHQEKAIRKLCDENTSIVVSSGTGSGKTECFTIPILNDLLEDETPGVRAILIYPLNALVNDQMERLRVLLKGTDITFGRFTGELLDRAERSEETLPNEIISREEIRDQGRIPQILITNYAMLEYLLIRPEDALIFNSGLWKYIVLDEAHTYNGAQGIEVAMLIRRLKQRLAKKQGDVLCVATSATLANDDPNQAVEFASKLFGEKFSPDDVIFGEEEIQHFDNSSAPLRRVEPSSYLNSQFEDMLEEIRKESPGSGNHAAQTADIEKVALWLAEIGLINDNDLEIAERHQGGLPSFLYACLSDNAQINQLRNWLVEKKAPVLFEEAAAYLFPEFDDQDQAKALFHLIELGALARSGPNQLALLPAKYHIFARPPQGMWACINPECSGKDPALDVPWSRIYSNPINRCESCGASVYPIYLCRECGQAFLVSHFRKATNEYLPAQDHTREGYVAYYFIWKPFEERRDLAIDTDDEQSDDVAYAFEPEEIQICLNCRRAIRYCSCDDPKPSIPIYQIYHVKTEERKGVIRVRRAPILSLEECPRCRSKAPHAKEEIATSISMSGTGPLANLTFELYRQLPASGDELKRMLPGEGRKLLTFYDSRQGAARFAAFLQDVANSHNYRHIIPEAIKQSLVPDEWSGEILTPDLFTLSQVSGKIAWEERILQNDSDSHYWQMYEERYSQAVSREAAIWMAKRILAEFTVGRKRRLSLESLGLAGVFYYQEDNRPDFAALARQIGFSDQDIEILVNYLLDGLRGDKAITLPNSIMADEPEFGSHIGHPCFIRQGSPRKWERRWIGVTAKQGRRRYVQCVLEKMGMDASEEAVIYVMNAIWDWLITQSNGLLEGSSSDGYRLSHRKLFFDNRQTWYKCQKCQRLSYRGDSLPCPFPHCGGDLEAIDIETEQKENYYFHLFQQALIPIRVEEHTAQLSPKKGEDYQKRFREGYINMLSCSTTFEMGIDLGDLQTVVMSNVPPTVANYRQRSGRAGRRTSGTAYIMTWSSDRPHDQAYYHNPAEIISGNVRVPMVTLENELIAQRHVNALLLSEFLRYRRAKGASIESLTLSGGFFDTWQAEPPHFHHLKEWAEANTRSIHQQLETYAIHFPPTLRPFIKSGLDGFFNMLQKVNDGHYRPITDYYYKKIEELAKTSADMSLDSTERDRAGEERTYFENLLRRIRGSRGNTSGYLINYLSENGVLPSYSFPLHTVELMLPRKVSDRADLRLTRDLRQAITEYAPGSEVVADKRLWASQRPLFWRDTPPKNEYRICEHCQYLEISEGAGVPLPRSQMVCSVCSEPYGNKSKVRVFVEPEGFQADPNSGKPAKQYVKVEPRQMRSALIPEHSLNEEAHNQFVYLAYNPKGRLLFVNEGKYGSGFEFPLKGFALTEGIKGTRDRYSLGHIQNTNTLHIRFEGSRDMPIPSPDNHSFWLSLLYAILHGASHALQIERQDIDGVLFPRGIGGNWEQTLVLYDNVPGGAGHVKNIQEHMDLVLEEARNILNCNDCAPDTSCYHCLRDYGNQYFHHELKRKDALAFLDLLIASLEPLDIGVLGAVRVVASDPTNWLYEKIRYAAHALFMAIPKMTLGHPKGENYTWMDTLNDLLNRGCEIHLYLQELPGDRPEDMSIASHLQVLMGKGLKLYQRSTIPDWPFLMDPHHEQRRIIKSQNGVIGLDQTIGVKSLLTSTNKEAVHAVLTQWEQMRAREITWDQLNPPQHVKVINVDASATRQFDLEATLDDFFTQPVQRMTIHDPYLFDRERLVNRLSPYIQMASRHQTLEKVIIHTKRADDRHRQDAAEQELKQRFPDLLDFKHTADHDRFLGVVRVSGERARIYIGRGFDFIRPDGSTRATYIVIQDPV